MSRRRRAATLLACALTAPLLPPPTAGAVPVVPRALPPAQRSVVGGQVTPPRAPTLPRPVPRLSAAEASPFVRTCGTELCLGAVTFPLHGASALFARDDPAGTARSAVDAGLNLVRVVDFLDTGGDPGRAPYDAVRWTGVDRVIAAAAAAGLKVELDLSTYRNLLKQRGLNPYSADWGPFVRWVATRRNTATGVRYRDDPTIALVAFAGEVEPPSAKNSWTTAQVTGFFARTLQQWRDADPNHLRTTGGFLYLDSSRTLDWQTILALPQVDVASIHVYSAGDRTVTLPAFAARAGALGKPWITEEFGMERGAGDAARAAWFQQVYADQVRYRSAGAGLWNLGPQTTSPTYDVNASTPLTLEVVRRNARPALPTPSRRWVARLLQVLRGS